MSVHRSSGNITVDARSKDGYVRKDFEVPRTPLGQNRPVASSSARQRAAPPPPPLALRPAVEDFGISSETSSPPPTPRDLVDLYGRYPERWERSLEDLCKIGACPKKSLKECTQESPLWKDSSEEQLDEIDPRIRLDGSYKCKQSYEAVDGARRKPGPPPIVQNRKHSIVATVVSLAKNVLQQNRRALPEKERNSRVPHRNSRVPHSNVQKEDLDYEEAVEGLLKKRLAGEK